MFIIVTELQSQNTVLETHGNNGGFVHGFGG
jgi:hypothetical protein